MGNALELARKIRTLAAAMNGLVVCRNLFLSRQEARVAHTMISVIDLTARPPQGPSLPDAIDMAARAIAIETQNACILAGLDDVQSETLMDISLRGIEAFTKACGMAKLEEIRAGQLESDWDAMLLRIDEILPMTLGANRAGFSFLLVEREPQGVNDPL